MIPKNGVILLSIFVSLTLIICILIGVYVFSPRAYIEAVYGTYPTAMLATTENITFDGSTTIVDGEEVQDGWIIMAQHQNQKSENGLYVVGANVWKRHPALQYPHQIRVGHSVFVSRGMAHAQSTFVLTLYTAEERNHLNFPPVKWTLMNRWLMKLAHPVGALMSYDYDNVLSMNEGGRLSTGLFHPVTAQWKVNLDKHRIEPPSTLDIFRGAFILSFLHTNGTRENIIQDFAYVRPQGILLGSPKFVLDKGQKPFPLDISWTKKGFLLEGPFRGVKQWNAYVVR